MFEMIAGAPAYGIHVSFLGISVRKTMLLMITGVITYAVNTCLLKDALDKINVCDDCQCGYLYGT